MTATLEQTQSDLPRLIDLAQQGEEVFITREGRTVAKLTGLPLLRTAQDRKAWLSKLAALRGRLDTGGSGPTVEQIITEDRGE